MKDYAAMSDFEINSAVSMALLDKSANPSPRYVAIGDYCNNPADAWSIIIGQKLSLINAGDEWLCVPDDATVDGVTGEDIQTIYFSYGYVDANPLRCAMIVFLMMKEGE